MAAAGNKVVCMMYHNGCPTAENGYDEIKKDYKNVIMYKVDTIRAEDIKNNGWADGSSKPYFKFYRKSVMLEEVAYDSSWSTQGPKVQEILAKYNGSNAEGEYSPKGKVTELKGLAEYDAAMKGAGEHNVVAILYHN